MWRFCAAPTLWNSWYLAVQPPVMRDQTGHIFSAVNGKVAWLNVR